MTRDEQGLSLRQWHARFRLQAGWTEQIRAHLFSRAPYSPGDTLLEVGCGTGAVLEKTKEVVPHRMIGLDLNLQYLKFAQETLPELWLTAGDGRCLPFPKNHFAITFCHYLLLWVARPTGILREMKRVTRPGGAVIALAEPDYQARLDHPQSLQALGESQNQALKSRGVDTAMGRKVKGLFHDQGLQDIACGILGAQWTSPNQPETQESEWQMLRADLQGRLAPEKIDCYEALALKALKDGRRILFIPTFFAIGFVP